jgi:leucyl/phenylalanyl-tRNA---protein transferase
MPIYLLTDELVFPDEGNATEEGILAVGGDLRPERLLLAYSSGIFPWYSDGEPIIWWSPDPRFVLFPGELKVSRSMRKILRQGVFSITFDKAFERVIAECKKINRKGQRGTWITPEMQKAYIRLYKLGFAHSVEAWKDGELTGGLYGVSLGKVFFGESMFSRVSNASKACLITLVEHLAKKGFELIDSQVYTRHLETLGAREIPRSEYLILIKDLLRY